MSPKRSRAFRCVRTGYPGEQLQEQYFGDRRKRHTYHRLHRGGAHSKLEQPGDCRRRVGTGLLGDRCQGGGLAVSNWRNFPFRFQTMIDPASDTIGVGVTIQDGKTCCSKSGAFHAIWSAPLCFSFICLWAFSTTSVSIDNQI